MSVGFGWSISDVALLAKTTRKVVHALNAEDGSSSDFQKATKSLESLQMTLDEIHHLLSTSESSFRNVIQTELDGSTSSIASFNARILQNFEKKLGVTGSKQPYRGVGRKLKWAFDAADELATFWIELSRQLETVKLLMTMQLWTTMSTITSTATASQKLLASSFQKSHTNHKEAIDEIRSMRTALTPLIDEVRNLCRVNNGLLLGSRQGYDLLSQNRRAQDSDVFEELSASLTSTAYEQILPHLEYRKSQRPIDSVPNFLYPAVQDHEDHLAHAFSAVANVLNDVKSQNYRPPQGGCAEQSQQFLQLQLNVEEIKRNLTEKHSSALQATKEAKPGLFLVRFFSSSIEDGFEALSKDLEQLFAFLQLALSRLHVLLLFFLPQGLFLLHKLRRFSFEPSRMLSGDVIRFQDLLGMNRYFDAEHFCHFEVFEAFLLKDFADKPGSMKVLTGRYRIMDAYSQPKTITKANWKNVVTSGANLIMSADMDLILANNQNCPVCNNPFIDGGSLGVKYCKKCDQSYHRKCPGHPLTINALADGSIPSFSSNTTLQAQAGVALNQREETSKKEKTEMKHFKHMHTAQRCEHPILKESSLARSHEQSNNPKIKSSESGSGGGNGFPTSAPSPRPSMGYGPGIWVCCKCSGSTITALCPESCSICYHRRCSSCLSVPEGSRY